MGKRGPKPSGTDRYAKKGATLGARITADTRQRLDAAARLSGRSLSAEVEDRLARTLDDDEKTEYHVSAIVRECMHIADDWAGQRWVNDPYTFDLMAGMVSMFIGSLRPEGHARVPSTVKLLASLAAETSPAFERTVRADLERVPVATIAQSLARVVVSNLLHGPTLLSGPQRATLERAAEYIAQLATAAPSASK